jgi:hypothetical protein
MLLLAFDETNVNELKKKTNRFFPIFLLLFFFFSFFFFFTHFNSADSDYCCARIIYRRVRRNKCSVIMMFCEMRSHMQSTFPSFQYLNITGLNWVISSDNWKGVDENFVKFTFNFYMFRIFACIEVLFTYKIYFCITNFNFHHPVVRAAPH